jgi:phosphate-selective porin OprO and OprP
MRDGAIDGGILDKWYFGINWWASRQWKVGVGEGIADLNELGIKGRMTSLLLRVQWVY